MADDSALTLNADLAAELRVAARELGYATPEAVVREAFDAWREKRRQAKAALAELRSLIDEADADLEAGRLYDPDIASIIPETRDELAHL